MPPPYWVRRFLIAPFVVALGIVALVVTPLALLIFLALIALAPHVRTLRVVWLAFVYLIWDAAALVALFVLWIASGSLGVWRILTGRRGWLKTDRLSERPHLQPIPAVWQGRDARTPSDWNLDWQPTREESSNG